MKISSTLVKESKYLFLKETSKLKEPWKQWYQIHAKYVGIAATEIAGGKNENLYKLCAWLHDFTKISGGKEHAKTGAKFAEKFLKDKLDKNTIKKVSSIIKTHSKKLNPTVKEGKIFQDADNLATFYPAVQRFIKKEVGKDALKENLEKSLNHIKFKKAKNIAKKYSKAY